MNKLFKLTKELIHDNTSKKDIAMAFIWYHYIVYQTDISISEINKYFEQNSLSKYNITYLKKDLRLSKNIIKGTIDNTYRPAAKFQHEMSAKFPFIELKSEEIITDDTILPEILLKSTRGYIENLGKQINASYNNNIFDGSAVLMRRLLEILLIHSYDEAGKLSEISDNDGMKNLSYIINYTQSKKPFKLSKEAIEVLDDFRQLGNFSAHKIQYNAKRKDIENVRLKYRVTIEELLYAAKLKN